MLAAKPRLVTSCDVGNDVWVGTCSLETARKVRREGTDVEDEHGLLGNCGRCPSHNTVVTPSLLSVVDFGINYSMEEEDPLNLGTELG